MSSCGLGGMCTSAPIKRFASLSDLLMSKPPGKCVWCGNPSLTKGHIWPAWFGKVLHLDAPHHEQIVGEIRTFVPTMKKPPYSRKKRQGHAGSRAPRNTCGDCNKGWMSRLEQASIPIAAPLFLGQTILLQTFEQRILAALLCLITIRVEFTDRATMATPQEDRQWLKEKLEPPPAWRIWIARYDGTESDRHWCRHHGMQIVSSPDESVGPNKCNTQTTTLVIGKLCAHLFSSTVFDDMFGYEGVHLTQIWPSLNLDIDWRHATSLSDAAILSLSEALVREMPSVPA